MFTLIFYQEEDFIRSVILPELAVLTIRDNLKISDELIRELDSNIGFDLVFNFKN